MKFFLFTILIISTLQAAPGLVVSLDSVAQRVRTQNLELRAARYSIDEAIGRMRQAGRYENPTVDFETRSNDRGTEPGIEIGFSQAFPVTSRLKLEKQLSALQVRAAEEEYREAANQRIGETQLIIVEILTLQSREVLLRRRIELARQLLESTEAITARGEGSPLDAAQAKIELAQATAKHRQLAVEKQQSLGKLRPLLGMKEGEKIHVNGMLSAAHKHFENSVVKRPALNLAKLETEQAGYEVQLEQAKRYDDLTAGIFLGAERKVDAPEAAEREFIAGLRLSIPLPLWDKNEGNIHAAEAKKLRKQAESDALQQKITSSAEAARNEMNEWAQLATEITEKLLPQAYEQSKITLQIWESGQGELRDVIRARQQELELEESYIDALAEFHRVHISHRTILGNH